MLRKVAISAFVVLNLIIFFKSFGFYGGKISGHDGQMYYAYVRSLVIDGDLDFENELTSESPRPEDIGSITRTRTGRVANKYPIGFSIMSLPFFLTAHWTTLLLNGLQITNLPADGYSIIYETLVPLGNLFYGLLGLMYLYKFLVDYYHSRYALLSCLTIWFSTSLFYYGAISTLMAHCPGFFLVNFCYYLTKKTLQRSALKYFILMGLASGLLLILRPTNIIFLLYPVSMITKGCFEPIKLKKNLTNPWGRIFIAITTAMGVISLQFIPWKIIYGSFITYSYGAEKFYFDNPRIIKVLFSTNHGLFFWSPVTLIAIVGLIGRLKNAWDMETTVFIIILSSLVYINASWHNWWFGYAFGARAFCESGVIFAFGLTYFLQNIIKSYKYSLMLCFAFVALNFYMLGLLVFEYVPPEGEFKLNRLIPFLNRR